MVLTIAVMSAFSGNLARAETQTWLCPICQTERIEREVGAQDLTCPSCELTLESVDLGWSLAYLSIRTRPTQVVWTFMPECGLYTAEGLLATPRAERIWVPWSAVDYWIPRQRILRLTSGEEYFMPYAMGPDCEREEQPLILATVADSVGDFSKGMSIRTREVEERMSTVFLVARSPMALDSARVRFTDEVEAGKHPRLPRTNPRAVRLGQPTVPPSASEDSLEVVLEVRVSEKGGTTKINRVKGSGKPEVDQAALVAAYRSSLLIGGEMGAGVPCSMILRYQFNHGTATVEAEPADPPMWREWAWPPLE